MHVVVHDHHVVVDVMGLCQQPLGRNGEVVQEALASVGHCPSPRRRRQCVCAGPGYAPSLPGPADIVVVDVTNKNQPFFFLIVHASLRQQG